jgi:hypothetical protein
MAQAGEVSIKDLCEKVLSALDVMKSDSAHVPIETVKDAAEMRKKVDYLNNVSAVTSAIAHDIKTMHDEGTKALEEFSQKALAFAGVHSDIKLPSEFETDQKEDEPTKEVQEKKGEQEPAAVANAWTKVGHGGKNVPEAVTAASTPITAIAVRAQTPAAAPGAQRRPTFRLVEVAPGGNVLAVEIKNPNECTRYPGAFCWSTEKEVFCKEYEGTTRILIPKLPKVFCAAGTKETPWKVIPYNKNGKGKPDFNLDTKDNRFYVSPEYVDGKADEWNTHAAMKYYPADTDPGYENYVVRVLDRENFATDIATIAENSPEHRLLINYATAWQLTLLAAERVFAQRRNAKKN